VGKDINYIKDNTDFHPHLVCGTMPELKLPLEEISNLINQKEIIICKTAQHCIQDEGLKHEV
jgi:hypothetical protein